MCCLLRVYCASRIARYVLIVVWCLLVDGCRWLLVACCLLSFVVSCVLCVALVDVRCVLCVVCCVLFIFGCVGAWWLVFAVRCLFLFVVCKVLVWCSLFNVC